MLAIPTNEIYRVLSCIYACIFRANEVLVHTVQNPTVFCIFIQRSEIFFVEIVRENRVFEFGLDMNFVVIQEHVFGRLCRNLRLELVEFLFHAFSYALGITLRFGLQSAVYRLIARLF